MTDTEVITPPLSFQRSSLLTFTGTTAAGVFVYALQVVMGRLLPVADYSLFTALIGVFNITALPLTALLLVITRNIALEVGRGDLAAASAVRRQALRQLALGGGALLLVALPLSGPLAHALGSHSAIGVALLWCSVGVNLFVALWLATLQGMQRFPALATVTGCAPALRLAFCAGAVALGYGVTGAMAGLLGSIAVAAAVCWIIVERKLPAGHSDHLQRSLLASREGITLAASNLAFVGLTQFDYIVVRVFCPADKAGLYAAGAVLAKAVLWLPVGLAVALYPTVASRHARSETSGHLLAQSLGMALVASGVLAGVLAIGASFWITHLYGSGYAGAATYLRWLSLAYLPMALVLVVDNYFLALGRARFIPFYALGALAQWAAFSVSGGTPRRMLWIVTAASAACFAWAVWIVVTRARGTRSPGDGRKALAKTGA